MTNKYGTKVVSKLLKSPINKQRAPVFRIKTVPVRAKAGNSIVSTNAFGLEVCRSEARAMVTVIKENIQPGIFVPFK